MKVINIKGAIVSDDIKWIYNLFDISAVSPGDVITELEKANGEDVTFIIDSGGGDIIAATSIYDSIRSYTGKTLIKVISAASAATIIMCATESEIVPTAMIMIHNVSSSASGDYSVMAHESEVLKTANRAISKAYQLKTGKSEDELLEMMNKETWLTADEAVEHKFVDKISSAKQSSVNNAGLQLTASLIDLIPNNIIANYQDRKAMMNTQLQLLKIKEAK